MPKFPGIPSTRYPLQRTAVTLCLPCLSQPDFSKKKKSRLLCLSPFPHLPLTSELHFSITVADWSLLISQNLGSCIKWSHLSGAQPSGQPVYTHLTYSDPHYYLEGIISHLISRNFCKHLLCARQHSRRRWGKEETIPALEKHSVQ